MSEPIFVIHVELDACSTVRGAGEGAVEIRIYAEAAAPSRRD